MLTIAIASAGPNLIVFFPYYSWALLLDNCMNVFGPGLGR